MQIRILPSLSTRLEPKPSKDKEKEKEKDKEIPQEVPKASETPKPQSRRQTNLLNVVRTPVKQRPSEESPLKSGSVSPIQPSSYSPKRVHSHPMTLPPKSTTPLGKLPQLRKTSLLSIPVHKSKRSYSKSKDDDSCSESSEQISDGSSSRCSIQALSISNTQNDLSPFLGEDFNNFKSFDGKVKEKFVSCGTHVRRTSIVTKEKMNDGALRVNQYKLMQKVGSGAYGKVFRAVDDEGNVVAVKVYNKRRLRSKWIGKGRTALQLVSSEIEIMQSASHERLINLYEVINQEDYHKIYLVLEYADGGTLHQKGKIAEKDAKMYFRQLIDGLEYLHENLEVVHRDIKPQNILFDANNNLKIADFGSAQYIKHGRDELTSSAGTFAFMSPEMHGGSRVYRGKPTDIWAAGITLYYMIEGKTPFRSRVVVELMNEVKTQEISYPSHFSETLQQLLSGMLEKDPDKRMSVDQIKQSQWFSSEN